MNGRNTSILSLLSGAAAGALAMYLLDPDQGERRRGQLAASAGDALKHGGSSLGTAWDAVTEQAKHLAEHASQLGATLATGASAAGEHVADAARGFSATDAAHQAQHAAGHAGQYVSALGQDLLGRVRDLRSRLVDGASSARENVSDRASDAADRARNAVSSARSSMGSWISGEPEHDYHITAHVVSVAATLAVGGAAMYFLDPKLGRTRRAWAGGKVHQIMSQTGRMFNEAGRSCTDLMNRTRGTAHELQRMVGEGPVTADQLLQRVRSQLGHAVSHANQIQVMTDAEGHVELTGRVLASELNTLLATIRNIGGVQQVTNRLDVLDREDQMAAGTTPNVAPQM